MHIGLIGGIGPAATDFYYRRLIGAFAERGKDLELTIVHADSPTLLANLGSDNKAAQVAIYQRLTERLRAAGAETVVVTSIAGHFCIEAFEAVSPLPLVNLLVEVNRAIEARGLKRIGILGTATVMKTRFYGGVSSAEIVPPAGRLLDEVHEAYAAMAIAGQVNDQQRGVFAYACDWFLKEAFFGPGDHREVQFIDLGDNGLSVGDRRLGRRELFNEAGDQVALRVWTVTVLELDSDGKAKLTSAESMTIFDDGVLYATYDNRMPHRHRGSRTDPLPGIRHRSHRARRHGLLHRRKRNDPHRARGAPTSPSSSPWNAGSGDLPKLP